MMKTFAILMVLACSAATSAHLQRLMMTAPWMTGGAFGPMPFGLPFPGSPFPMGPFPGGTFPSIPRRQFPQPWNRNTFGVNLPLGPNHAWNTNRAVNNPLNPLNPAGQLPFDSSLNTANDPWATYRLLTNSFGSNTGTASIGGTTSLGTSDVTGSSSLSARTGLSSVSTNPSTGVVSDNYPWNTLANPNSGFPATNTNFGRFGNQNWNGVTNAGLSPLGGGVPNSPFADSPSFNSGVPNNGFVNTLNQVQPMPQSGFLSGK